MHINIHINNIDINMNMNMNINIFLPGVSLNALYSSSCFKYSSVLIKIDYLCVI